MTNLLLGILAGFMTASLGWQINLISIHRGVERGPRATFWTGLGAISADMIWITAAFAGAESLLIVHHEWARHLKWLGICTIVLAGLRILFHNAKAQAESEKRHGRSKDYLTGLLIVMGNPAVLILWIGVVSFILTHIASAQEGLFPFFFLGGFSLGGIFWFLILSAVLLPRIQKWTDQRFHIISKIFAVLLLIGAVILIFEKF